MSTYENLSETQKFACRVIADHARSTAFSIADGILPGNEGRNYVLRKIMRRAIYHGREHLGYTDPFFFKVCDFVVDEMHAAFPELGVQRDLINRIVRLEELRFVNTITVGLEKYNQLIPNLEKTLLPHIQQISQTTRNIAQWGQRVKGIQDQQMNALKRALDRIQSTSEQTISGVARIIKVNTEIEESLRPVAEALKAKLTSLLPQAEKDELNRIIRESTDLETESHQSLRTAFYEFAKLYDTFGTPRDLIRIALEDAGVEISENRFNTEFDAALNDIQKDSGLGKTERKSAPSPIYADVLAQIGTTEFLGYESTRIEGARIVALIRGDVQLLRLDEGEEGGVVLDRTPFYAESGGQVGDTGFLTTDNGAVARVVDTYAPVSGLIVHKVVVEKGSLRPYGDELYSAEQLSARGKVKALTQHSPPNKILVKAVVDEEKRDATRRNHTATHLVHAALKEVLGTHVKQAGSVVAPNYLRFDFTHYQPMTAAEIREVEDLVNRYVLQNEPVTTNMMSLEDAMRSGAVAMFGEKYGSEVRVLRVGDGKFSMELCGGTHVRATGDIGSFKITSDEAIASGVRRIRAITGFDAFERFREDEVLIDRSLEALKTQRDNLPSAIERLQEEVKRLRKEVKDLNLKNATYVLQTEPGELKLTGGEANITVNRAEREIGGVKVLGKIVDGLDANGQRQLSDTLLARLKSGVVVLGRKDEGKASIIVRVSADLTDKIKAGNIVKEIVPLLGGRGGGRPDMAEGGGPDADKLSEAIDAAYASIEKMAS